MNALIILAAGLSKRFGDENKLLADLNGKPILQHVLETAEVINCGQRLAVVLDNADVKNICKSYGYDTVLNSAPEHGQGRSIALGAEYAIKSGAKSACIMLGDMPFVSSEHLEKLLEASADSDCVFSTYDGNRLPPAIFSGEALRRLTSLDANAGAKSLFLAKDSVGIALPSLQAQDIDTQDELQKLEAN